MKILLSGAAGRMGRCIAAYCRERRDCHIVAGIDCRTDNGCFEFPIWTDFQNPIPAADVLIDFSSPEAAQRALIYGAAQGIPSVICTTGLTEQVLHTLRFCAGTIPVFASANMSLAASLMQELCRQAADILGEEWNIDILEEHHPGKIDIPSGTALALGKAVGKGRKLCSEEDSSVPRQAQEIIFHSLRAGGSAGEHLVQFASADETLQISHTVFHRRVFAAGAIAAARFLIGKPPGLYNMKDLIKK